MSVASFIRGNDFNEFKYFIKAHIPNRKYFISSTGYPAFSKSIPVLVPCGGISSYESGQIGEISDFLFCLEIARYIDSNKEDVFDSLTWRAIQLYNGCIKRQLEAETQSQESIGMFYNAVSCCRNYIHGVNCDIKDLINYANIIIRAEHYFHYTEHYTFKEYLTKLFMPCPNHLIADISQLVNVFIDCFITSGLVRKNSSVICHPWFEPWSSELGGGIADLYLDGVLYDFKSTKKTGYSWEDVGQIYAYYILSQLCAKHPTESSFWANYPVHAISLYYARLGDVETCCLSNSNTMLTESNLDVIDQIIFDHNINQISVLYAQYLRDIAVKIINNKIKNNELGKNLSITPNELEYQVGDTIYSYVKGKGSVLRFYQRDSNWRVVVKFDTGEILEANINFCDLLNWDIGPFAEWRKAFEQSAHNYRDKDFDSGSLITNMVKFLRAD